MPRDDDQIVELTRVPSRLEADLLVGRLSDAGIRATVAGGDAEGWAPHLALFHGHRVLVFAGDLDPARRVLAEAAD